MPRQRQQANTTKLAAAVEAKGIAVRDLAEEIGMGHTVLWRLMNGGQSTVDGAIANAIALAKYFGTTVEKLFSDREA